MNREENLKHIVIGTCNALIKVDKLKISESLRKNIEIPDNWYKVRKDPFIIENYIIWGYQFRNEDTPYDLEIELKVQNNTVIGINIVTNLEDSKRL